MATLAATAPREEPAREERFSSNLAIFMALVIVAGFSTQFLAGRSTFASPLRVHFHAIAFMGWTAIFVTAELARHARPARTAPQARLDRGRLAGTDGDGRTDGHPRRNP